MWSVVYFLVFCFFFGEIVMSTLANDRHIYNYAINLNLNKVYSSLSQKQNKPYKDHPEIYCYSEKNKTIWNIWMSVSIITDLYPSQYDLFIGSDSQEVWGKYEADDVSWNFNLWNSNYITLNPFKSICLIIETKRDYQLSLHIDKTDYCLLFTFIFSVVLFLSSSLLCTTSFSCYLIGITLSACVRVLIPLYCVVNILPLKRPSVLGSVAGFTAVFIYMIYKNIFTVLEHYKMHVIGYCCLTGLLSFYFCYNFCSFNNLKSESLCKWFLRTLAAYFIFSSTYMYEVFIPTLLILVSFIYLPSFQLIKKLRKLRSNKVAENYHSQGCVETEKALRQLREYCISSEFKRWKYVPKLQDPWKFAKFMKGEPHLSEQEIIMYEYQTLQNRN